MSMRFGWVIKSAAIGLIALLFICYIFSVANPISVRQSQMQDKLEKSGDHAFDNAPGGYVDIMWLALLGSLITLFAGGMAAAVISRLDKSSEVKWLMTAAIVAIFTVLVMDAYIYMGWDRGMQEYNHSREAGYGGRPIDPTPFCIILFIMMLLDAIFFLASTAGWLVVRLSGSSKC